MWKTFLVDLLKQANFTKKKKYFTTKPLLNKQIKKVLAPIRLLKLQV